MIRQGPLHFLEVVQTQWGAKLANKGYAYLIVFIKVTNKSGIPMPVSMKCTQKSQYKTVFKDKSASFNLKPYEEHEVKFQVKLPISFFRALWMQAVAQKYVVVKMESKLKSTIFSRTISKIKKIKVR